MRQGGAAPLNQLVLGAWRENATVELRENEERNYQETHGGE